MQLLPCLFEAHALTADKPTTASWTAKGTHILCTVGSAQSVSPCDGWCMSQAQQLKTIYC